MFINARPRPDMNGFRSFVPSRLVELPYNWPHSMANHWKNAWGNLRPVTFAAVSPGPWIYHSDEANNAESYSDPPTQNFIYGPYDAVHSYAQARLGNKSTPGAPRMLEYQQIQPNNTRQLDAESLHNLQTLRSGNLESDMPQHGADVNSHGWSMGRQISDSSRFSKAGCSNDAMPYIGQPSLDIDDGISMSSSAGGPSFLSLYDASSACDNFVSNNIESDMVYQNAFERDIDHSAAMAFSSTAPDVQCSFSDGKLWNEVETGSSESADPCSMASSFNHDGLPNPHPPLWPPQLDPSTTWSQQIAPPGTVSPQALSLVARSTSPKHYPNSPCSSSEQLSETSIMSKALQDSPKSEIYPMVQTKRAKSSQYPQTDMPSERLRSARSGRVKTLQIQNFNDRVPNSMSQPASSQRLQDLQSVGNSRMTAQSGTVESLDLDRNNDKQHLAAQSGILQTNKVHQSTVGLQPCEVGSEALQGFLTQSADGAVQHSTDRVLRPRHKLPSGRFSEAYSPPISDNAGNLNKPCKGFAMTSHQALSSRLDKSPSAFSTIRQYHRKTSSLQRPLKSKKSETKIVGKQVLDIMTDTKRTASLTSAEDTAQQRIAKDKFLLDAKRNGKSYKQIRLEGGFTEAESTLRGRHRTLTKKPEERVRKPEWESNDLRLLKKAVHKLAGDPSLSRPKKVSWKEVSDYIIENGGSYRFGNSTCRKKWSELYAISSDQDLS